MIMLAALPLLLSLAPLPGNAGAQSEALPLPQLVSAFRSVCLEHIADSAGQARAAVGAPWAFAVGESNGLETRYRNQSAILTIEPAGQACTITAEVPSAETVASLQAALANIVPPENWEPLNEADSRYVLITLDSGKAQFAISFKISDKSGFNLATLSVAKP